MDTLTQISSVVLGFAVTLGPLVSLLVLLNLRDRRQARVLHAVLDQLGARELRGHVAVQVRGGWLVPGRVVRVHLLGCSREEIWDIMTQLLRRLSPQVRLEVTGPPDRHVPVTLTVTTTSRRPWPRPVPAPAQEALSA